MKLVDHLKKTSESGKFNYQGTIYGSEPFTATALEIAEMLEIFGDDSLLVDHPANGGGDGFYIEGVNNDIYYDSNNIQELVFEKINDG